MSVGEPDYQGREDQNTFTVPHLTYQAGKGRERSL